MKYEICSFSLQPLTFILSALEAKLVGMLEETFSLQPLTFILSAAPPAEELLPIVVQFLIAYK
ncbi:hypothetical protein [Chroococcidiopsis sp. CCMEE 29]|uniref:hypothetical protein n=1 Tax=Chroococcidiopsis sp. CCMEE 29 TaxID=155894 RepID=UPI0020223B7B|nr:hypothetical protein [Chroococcidiopsis sp. CCMEE 29]